jgi:hypothetical protein
LTGGKFSQRVHLSYYAVGKHRVPQGHFENSPAFQCRGLIVLHTSPAGTTENGACRVAALAKTGFVSAVPVGLDVFPTDPGIEMPGYSQLFLRNRTLAQKLRCAQIPTDLPLVFTGRAIGNFLQCFHCCHRTGGGAGGIVFAKARWSVTGWI